MAGCVPLQNAAVYHDPVSKQADMAHHPRPSDLIFTVPKIIAHLSQGTTLPKGTVILTGTPSGIGFLREPTEVLHEGDEFVVQVEPHIGSLCQVFENEK